MIAKISIQRVSKAFAKLVHLAFILTLLLSLPNMGIQAPAPVQAAPDIVTLHSVSLPGDSSGYLSISNTSNLNFSSGSLTIEAWIKRTTLARNETIFGNGWQHSYWFGLSSTGALSFTPDGYAHHANSATKISPNVWTHVAVVFSGASKVMFYINGALDSTTTMTGVSLLAANSPPTVNIGFDRDNTFSPNYFSGQIDEVRIWRSIRSPDEIKNNLFSFFGSNTPNLRGQWRMEGNANDSSGWNGNAIMEPSSGFAGGTYDSASPLPKDINIPQIASAPSLDGSCGTSEYLNAVTTYLTGATISLVHTASDLWVCFNYLDSTLTSTSVYLDPQYTRVDPSQSEHLRLTVNQPNPLSTRTTGVGNAAGNYTTSPLMDGQWDAIYLIAGPSEFPTYQAEFRISSALLGGMEHQIGLALSTDDAGRGGLYLWPALAAYSQPSTWSSTILTGAGPSRTFSGTTKYQPKNSALPVSPVGGVTVNLVGSDPNGSEAIVASVQSDSTGAFSITSTSSFANHRLEAGSPPQGMVYSKSVAGNSGTSIDLRTIGFSAAAAGTYANNQFILADATPSTLDSGYGPIYEIIATQATLDSGALNDFIEYKTLLGFTVETKSLESIDSTMSGANRQDRIRAWEKNRRTLYGSRFAYVLLVGSQATIPHIPISYGLTGKMDNTCADVKSGKVKVKYSDWYYVDLVNNFDSNNNGCYLDGIWTASDALKAGYTPDAAPAFAHTVSVGRIPFDSTNTIKSVLRNSANFERQSKPYKMNALFGMSMLTLEGYMDDGNPCKDKWGERCVAPTDTGNYDMAVLVEKMKSDFLNFLGFNSKSYYENVSTVAGGSGITSSPMISNTAIESELNAKLYGFVDFDGHGNSTGVYRVFWPGDLNHDGVMNLSDTPALNEVAGADLFRISNLNNLTPDNNLGGVYYVMACSTADPNDSSNFASTILSGGHGVASIAATGVITVGSWTAPSKSGGVAQHDNYYIAQRILEKFQFVGDALWGTLADRLSHNSTGSGQLQMTLFGDPSLSYFGNPSAGTRRAPWSMQRREATGQAYFPLPGPALPKKQWEYNTGTAPTPTTLFPSPVVSADSEVIVAAGNAVRVLRNGVLHQTLTLDAQAYGSPALAADGTIYVVDVTGKVYAFVYPTISAVYPDSRSRRWTAQLDNIPLTSPSIAPDGTILVGYDYPGEASHLAFIRPDGEIYAAILNGKIQGGATATADRIVYATTLRSDNGQGTLYRIDSYCMLAYSDCTHKVVSLAHGGSSAPLFFQGQLYVGMADGSVAKFNPKTLTQVASYAAGGRITAGPVTGPGSQILVSTAAGKFISLTTSLSLRWSRTFEAGAANGIPAFSSDGLYMISNNRLTALNPSSGATLWQRYIAGVGYGSAAVGYGRMLYFQTQSGKIEAYGEGWVNPPTSVFVNATKAGARPINQLSWYLDGSAPLPLSASGAPEAASPAAMDSSDAVNAIGGVLLQRSLNGSDWETIALLPAGTTSYNDTNINGDASYQYRLQIIDSSGQNSDYAIAEAVDSLPDLPAAPVLSSVTALSASTLKVQWNAPASVVDQYRIESASSAVGPFAAVATIESSCTTYLDNSLTAATTHYYRVIATNKTGASPASNILSAKTFTQNLAAPQNLAAQLTQGSEIDLSWTGRPAGAQAVIEVQPFGSLDWQNLSTVDANTFKYITGEPNSYTFRVKFVQGTSESAYAQTVSSYTVQLNLRVFLPHMNR